MPPEPNLDELEWEYTPRRHNEGDDRVIALIAELCAARRVVEAARAWRQESTIDFGGVEGELARALAEYEAKRGT